MRKGNMLGATLAALVLMESMPKLDGLGSSSLAPDLEDLKLPDTSDVARRTRELEERQSPSRKKRLRMKARQR
jgi:hypothetical protein